MAGEWVRELERVYLKHRGESERTVTLDFAGVNFIDSRGVEMLEKIKDSGVRVINCSIFIESLLCGVLANKKSKLTKEG